ncbi:hypothetical protein DPMN_045975 [Dreissena polymorpha]|uniref:Chitin-binding type-2 domain-containing protein n=1 Tax=Dreissena polymorpha TaxID=45954 RepID=A0A9D4D723_DREPO|nr:hypothetical protein DPMN_045975 [Dreissena polymorpha]
MDAKQVLICILVLALIEVRAISAWTTPWTTVMNRGRPETTGAPPDKRAGCRERAVCSKYEHDQIRLRLMHGTNCTSFCHCATLATHVDGTVTYYWVRQNCAPGTKFDSSIGVCNHAGAFVCEDGWLTPPA